MNKRTTKLTLPKLEHMISEELRKHEEKKKVLNEAVQPSKEIKVLYVNIISILEALEEVRQTIETHLLTEPSPTSGI